MRGFKLDPSSDLGSVLKVRQRKGSCIRISLACATPTPEGHLCFFLIVCLYAHFYWAVLAESQTAWETIWPIFVKRGEARSSKERCISFLITDGHKVH